MAKTIQEIINEKLHGMAQEQILIRYGETGFSVGRVRKQTEQIAGRLISQGTVPGTRIALIVRDREQLIAGILGVLLARCVFVPFEYDMPRKVMADMADTAEINTVITDDMSLLSSLDGQFIRKYDLNEILVEDRTDETEPEAIERLVEERGCLPEDPVYIYFTSGTTGRPKAILGQNKGLVHFLEWEKSKISGACKNISQLTSTSHDPFLRDIFLPFLLEGTCCIPENKAVILDGNRLKKWLQVQKINLIHCTPSLMNHLLHACASGLEVSELKYIFLAGERVTPGLVGEIFDLLKGNFEIKNLYGPTETTMAKFCYDISAEDRKRESIPVGRPIDDTACLLLNDEMEACDEGEIFIRTEYRTLGYLNREELNEQAFIRNPLDAGDEVLLYRTGDLGRRLADGNIEFLGRKDRQRKIRGNRVEPGYIEEQIEKLDDIRKCVITYTEGTAGEEFLTAYLISDRQYTRKQITDQLVNSMPSYMIPAYFVFLDEFPMTPNMKVDEKALPDPRQLRSDENGPYNVQAVSADNTAPSEEDIAGTGRGLGFEDRLLQLCSEVLDTDAVDIEENFISLGGSSLSVMTLISRIYEEFSVEMSLEDILMSDSLRTMADIIRDKAEAYEADGDDSYGSSSDAGAVSSPSEKKSLQVKQYSKEEYLRAGEEGADKAPSTIKGSSFIKGVSPFNAVFYRSCIYNAFISAVKFWGKDELLFMSNDLPLYGKNEEGRVPGRIRYIEKKPLPELLETVGIEMELRDRSGDITGDIAEIIDGGGMVILGVDCFFESIRRDFYLQKNWPHNILVTGYDAAAGEAAVLEQTGVNNLDYHEQRLGFKDLEYAYNSNRLRFPNFEDGRNFVVLHNRGGAKDCIALYYQRYLENLHEHEAEVLPDIDNIAGIISYLAEHTGSLAEIKREYSNLIMLLDSIIESKYAQAYMFERFMKVHEEWGYCRDRVTELVKAWKRIRNVIFKINLTQAYQETSILEALAGLENIKALERQLYSRIL